MRLRPFAITIVGLLLAAATVPLQAAPLQVHSLTAGTTDSALVAADPAVTPGVFTTQGLRVFCGFNARETGGSSGATVNIYNGTDATGQLLFTFSLTASESRSEGPWFDTECIPTPNGVFIDRGGTGTTLLVVYTRQSTAR